MKFLPALFLSIVFGLSSDHAYAQAPQRPSQGRPIGAPPLPGPGMRAGQAPGAISRPQTPPNFNPVPTGRPQAAAVGSVEKQLPPTEPLRMDTPVESLLSEDLIRSLRDPFQLPSILLVRKETPRTELETYGLKDFKLNGVITGPKKTRAMVSTPNNKVFFVRVGDRIGVREGKVTQILPDGIKITEFFTDEHGKRVPDVFEITMTGEFLSLTKKEE